MGNVADDGRSLQLRDMVAARGCGLWLHSKTVSRSYRQRLRVTATGYGFTVVACDYDLCFSQRDLGAMASDSPCAPFEQIWQSYPDKIGDEKAHN